MRLIDADALLSSISSHYCEDCDKRKGMRNGKIKTIYQIGDAPCRACWVDDMDGEIDSAPTIDAVPTASITRIEKELHGRDVEMQYEIIRWLWNYGNQFTDSRTAILQWLRGE